MRRERRAKRVHAIVSHRTITQHYEAILVNINRNFIEISTEKMNKCEDCLDNPAICSGNQLDNQKNYKRKVRDILDAVAWICEKYESNSGCGCSSKGSDAQVWRDEINKFVHDIQEKNGGRMVRDRATESRRVEAKPNRKFKGYKRDMSRGYKRGPTTGLKYHDIVPIGEGQGQYQNQHDGDCVQHDFQREANGIKRKCNGWARRKNIKNLTIQIENDKPVTDLSDKVEAMML